MPTGSGSGKRTALRPMGTLVAVAEQGNVLLICKKGEEQRIKQFVADAQEKFKGKFN